jgi:hypothetical protein
MRLATAEAQAQAAAQQAALVDRQMELAAIRRQVAPPTPPVQPSHPVQQANDMDAVNREIAAKQAEGARLAAAAPAADKPAAPGPLERSASASGAASGTTGAPSSATRVDRFKALIPLAGIDPAKLAGAMAKYGAARFTELSDQHQEALLTAMQKAADAKQAEWERVKAGSPF